jgi:hypothetical protein
MISGALNLGIFEQPGSRRFLEGRAAEMAFGCILQFADGGKGFPQQILLVF